MGKSKAKPISMASLSKTVATHRRMLLLLVPLLVVYVVLMTATIHRRADGSADPRALLRRQSTFVAGTLHPTSPFYERGDNFDLTVKRD
jgi:hypothetical protein